MKFNELDMPVDEIIRSRLREIEREENVRILHAVESGSRAWGFASPDSDYDVRFIYVRPHDFYLSLHETKDVIDWELNEVLDINGWDIKKALQHFHKSNATMFEWSNSPIVYETSVEWDKLYKNAVSPYFSCKAVMYHYYGTANKNYHEYFTGELVSYKKYLYVLRPLLACRWVEDYKCPPPVPFDELLERCLDDKYRPVVNSLLEQKKQMSESDKAQRIEQIDYYIVEKLAYYKELLQNMPDDRKSEWAPLDTEFRRIVDESDDICLLQKRKPQQTGGIKDGVYGLHQYNRVWRNH